MSARQMLWLERVYARCRLPFWVGAFVIGYLPFIAGLYATYLVAGVSSDFIPQVGSILPFTVPIIVLWHFAIRYTRSQIEGLRDYALSMMQEKSSIPLQSLYGFRGVVIGFIIANLDAPLFFASSPAHYSFLQKVIILIPWLYIGMILGVFFWVWMYSMYSIYKMGRLPMKLRHFAEDKLLGLKPFSSTLLRLAGLYLTVVGLLIFPSLLSPFMTLPLLSLYIALTLGILVFFFLPLIALHRKLIAAKKEAGSWTIPRYVRIVERLKANDDDPSNSALVSELIAIDKIQRDIQQIRTWPFDTGILVRLAAMVLAVTTVIIARIVTVALQL